MVMPLPVKPSIAMPLTVIAPPDSWSPAPDASPLPSILTPGKPSAKSGWVVPSISTGLETAGSVVRRKMSPLAEATALKSIVSAIASAFAAAIASRSVHSVASQLPVPGSSTEFTWNVVAAPAVAANDAPAVRASTRAKTKPRRRIRTPQGAGPRGESPILGVLILPRPGGLRQVRVLTSGVQAGQPGRGLVDHLVALAEREADERAADLLVVVEDDRGDGDDAGALGQREAERVAVLLAERADVGGDEVGARRPEDLKPGRLQPGAEPVALGLEVRRGRIRSRRRGVRARARSRAGTARR